MGRDEGGVQVTGVPASSAAARAGFKANDLIQAINGQTVSNTSQLHAALILAADAPLKVRVVRNQQPQEVLPGPVPLVITESSNDAGGFSRVALPERSSGAVVANQETSNDPLGILTDGIIARTYGPVFGNGIRNGAYKMDLGSSKPVAAVNSWSFNQNGSRARQILTIHGSNSTTDPGWNLADASLFTPLATLDTASLAPADFAAASLRCAEGQSLGSFRWIVRETTPLNPTGENTAYQEFSVETVP